MFSSVTTSPAPSSSRPTRLVAWMYSALVFGCPSTTIRPSRVMSRPTEIMFVAIATSTFSFSWKRSASRRFASATLSVLTREVSSTHLVGDLPVGEQPFRLSDAPSSRVAREPRADLVLDDAPAAAQFAEAVEVAQKRHVGVGRVLLVPRPFLGPIRFLGGAEQRKVGPQQDHFRAPPLSGNAQVTAGVALLRCVGDGKEGVAPVRPGRREDVYFAAVEQRPDLPVGPAHRGGRGDDLGPNPVFPLLRARIVRRAPSRTARPSSPSGRRSGATRPG